MTRRLPDGFFRRITIGSLLGAPLLGLIISLMRFELLGLRSWLILFGTVWLCGFMLLFSNFIRSLQANPDDYENGE